MKLGIKGTFTLLVRDEQGNITKELQFDNLITNNGMDRIAGGTSGAVELFDRLVLSTNTTTPVVTDTAMGGTIVSTTTSSSVYSSDVVNSGSPNYIFTWRSGWKFATGTATGTWASIGMDVQTGNILFCKTLIKSGGVPTTLTILSTESLDIRYDLTITPVLTDSTGTVVINGTSHSWTGRVWGISDTSATSRAKSLGITVSGYKGGLLGGGTPALGAITAGGLSSETSPPHTGYTSLFISGGNTDPSSVIWGTYTSGSFTRDFTYKWGSQYVATGGVVSVGGCFLRPGGPCPPYQFVFSPAIPKGATEELSLTFTVTWVRL